MSEKIDYDSFMLACAPAFTSVLDVLVSVSREIHSHYTLVRVYSFLFILKKTKEKTESQRTTEKFSYKLIICPIIDENIKVRTWNRQYLTIFVREWRVKREDGNEILARVKMS